MEMMSRIYKLKNGEVSRERFLEIHGFYDEIKKKLNFTKFTKKFNTYANSIHYIQQLLANSLNAVQQPDQAPDACLMVSTLSKIYFLSLLSLFIL